MDDLASKYCFWLDWFGVSLISHLLACYLQHENLFTLEEFENLFIHVHIVNDKQYTYPWPLKIKLSIFT